MADPQEVSEVHLGVTQFDATQGTQAKHLKGFIGQVTSVWQWMGMTQLRLRGFLSFSYRDT